MPAPTISNSKTTTPTKYGGDALNNINNFLNGVDVTGNIGTPIIRTPVKIPSNVLSFTDPAEDNTVTVKIPALSANKNINLIPANLTDNDEVVFKDSVQTLTGKVISASSNTITNIDTTNLSGSADIVTTTNTKTLTNKTLTSPVISTISNTGTVTIPTGTRTLVARDTTDTLTNKTLTNPVISSIENSGTVTLPVGPDTLVGRATTDTLTNKTLTAPVISTISNSGTITLPTGTRTLVARDTTDTLTNKTLTTPIISSISNTGTLTLPTSTDTLVGRATTDTLTNKTLTSPTINSPTLTNSGNTLTLPTSADTLVGRATTDTLTNKTLTSPVISSISNSGTVTLPTGTRTLVARDTTDTLTNKTIDADSNTITNIENADIKTGAAIATSKLADSGNFILKTQNNDFGAFYQDIGEIAAPASPGVNKLRLYMDNSDEHLKTKDSSGTVVDLSVGGGGGGATVLDDLTDVNTPTPAPNDVLTWDDTNSEWIAAAPPGSGGGEANTASNVGTGAGVWKDKVSADLRFRSIIGGTGLTQTQNADDVTIDIDSTVTTLTGSQTLTNKTLTTPVISSISNTGTLTLPTSTDTLVGRVTTDTLTNKTLTSPTINSPTLTNSGNTLTLPTSTDTLVGRATTDTLTNKTLTSPVISSISNTGTLTLPTSTDTLVGRATTDTLTNKSIDADSNTITNIENADIKAAAGIVTTKLADSANFALTTRANTFGDFANIFKDNQLKINNPADTFAYTIIASAIGANRNLTLPLLTGNDTAVTEAHSQTLTNKTIAAGSNTISGIADANISTHTTTKISTTSKSLLNSAIVYNDQTNSFGDFDQVFKDNRLRINNPADTFSYTIIGAALAANRNLTLPLLTGNDTAVTEAHTQTLTNKTIDADSNTLTNIENADIKAAAGIVTSKLADASNFALTNQSNTFGDFDQIFRDNRIRINNPADTFSYTIIGAAIAANRNLTLPLLTGNDTVVTEAHTQTLTNKTLTSPVISTISNTGTLTLPTSTDTLVGKATTDTFTNKTFDADATGNSITNIENADIKAAAGIVTSKLADSANFLLKTQDNTLGAHYLDVTEIAAPASPSANNLRVYMDNSDEHLKVKNSSGTVTDLFAAGGGITSSSTDTLTNKTINPTSNTILYSTPFAYTIYQDGGAIKARNNLTGAITSNTNIDPLLVTILASGNPSVEIQPGFYNLSAGFSGFSMVTDAHIKGIPWATLNVPTSYTGSVFKFSPSTTNCFNASVEGIFLNEQASSQAYDWTAFEFAPVVGSSDWGVVGCRVEGCRVYRAKYAIRFSTNGMSWGSDNKFVDVFAEACEYLVYFEHANTYTSDASGFHANKFDSLTLQATAANGTTKTPQTQGGIIGVIGDWNTFINCNIWDIQASNSSASSMTISANARGTTIIAGILTHRLFTDSGTRTIINDDWTGLQIKKPATFYDTFEVQKNTATPFVIYRPTNSNFQESSLAFDLQDSASNRTTFGRLFVGENSNTDTSEESYFGFEYYMGGTNGLRGAFLNNGVYFGLASSNSRVGLLNTGISGSNKTFTFPNASGELATIAATQTLTNKTLTAPTISTITNTGTITLPTSTDTLVGKATTDNLTNKTMYGTNWRVTAKSADATLAADESIVPVSASGANRTMTLPAVASSTNKIYIISKTDSSANTVTIDGASSETINGATTFVLTQQYQSVMIWCDGSAWYTQPNSTERTGKAVASGTGAQTAFTISHGLGATPSNVFIDCSSHAIARTFTVDSTTITVTFSSAPSSGTNNVIIYWRVVA